MTNPADKENLISSGQDGRDGFYQLTKIPLKNTAVPGLLSSIYGVVQGHQDLRL